ncbi:MAG: hypothetical protein AB7H96_05715 [Vicinamibacterales bacterium]
MNFFATIVPFHPDYLLSWVLLYIGPDVFLPLTSALAAMAGFLLMFWQRVLGFVMRLMGKGGTESAESSATTSDASRDHQKTS